jgi:NADH:ubiquinone oxidoreductase subunit E
MMSTNAVTFQEALEIVESLPDYQQDDLIDIIRRRRLDRRREALLENIKEAQAEYERGECRTGTVEDLMREIDE